MFQVQVRVLEVQVQVPSTVQHNTT